MKLNPIVAHLRATCPSFAQRISGGIDWDAVVESAQLALPAAYVIASADAAAPSRAQNATIQDITEQFAVVIVLDTSDERGQQDNDLLHDLRAELWRALVGWRPGEDYDPIEYDKGSLLHISRARLVFQFTFFSGFQLGRNSVGRPGEPLAPAETWAELEQDGLTDFTGATFNMDCIDPADRNLQHPGPDGRIEVKFSGDVSP
ncbi:phage tail terminator protein [Pseudomonas sp. ES3]|uniref:phage tail terminator protein n=1 Tax=Pseudomonas sp. ES3 TaxID=3424776 RepID=UPI003D32E938